MKSGASKAKREAKKAAAQQYYNAFSTLRPVNERIKGVDKNVVRQLDDAETLETSGRTRKTARQLDRTAREIKRDDGYADVASRFNQRYDNLKKQLAGQNVTRYSLLATPVASNQKASTGITGIGQQQSGGQQQSKGMLAGIPNFLTNQTKGKDMAGRQYFSSRDEALAAAEKAAPNKTVTPPRNLAGLASFGATPKAATAEQLVSTETLPSLQVGYRNLSAMGQAYDELNALGGQLNNTAGAKAAERYTALAQRLKKQIGRDASQPSSGGQVGLLGSELAGSGALPEVIR